MPEILGLEILAMRKAAEELQPYQRQDCPVCGYALQRSVDEILHCLWCGWTDMNLIKRDVGRT